MPTCIRCEKVMKSGYKKIKTLKTENIMGGIVSHWSKAWACKNRFCNVDLDLKNGYEDLDGVWNIVNKPKEPDYRDSSEYKDYRRMNRQDNIPKEEQISLFGIIMINMFRREMGRMREEKDKLTEELRVLKGEDHYAAGWVCWEGISLHTGYDIAYDGIDGGTNNV